MFKNKGNIRDVANYRSISLTCIVRRLYERMLLTYLVPCTEGILDPSQGGFRPKRSTLHQCYALHEVMEDNPDIIHAFLDLKAAYDCVNRSMLWRDMKAYGVSEHMIAVCQSLFDFNMANLVVNGTKSEDIRCVRGLLQGSSMSPLLFNLYINSLLVLLDRKPKVSTRDVLRSNSLFFADDGALHARSRLGMQSLLDVCSEWATEYGMDFAAGKCAIMWEHEADVHVDFTIQGGIIPTVETFVYLGVECSAKGMLFEKKQKERCANMMSTARFLKAKGMNALGWRLNCRVLVYKSFLRPIMEYGCALMRKPNNAMVTFMEKAQNNVLNMALSCSRTTSTGGKLKLLQIETVGARVTKLQYGFFKSLSVNGPTDAPASVLWHGAGGVRSPPRPTKLQKAAVANPIFRFSIEHDDDPKAVHKYMTKAKIESMQVYDKTNAEGKRDIAASIQIPARLGPSVYTDPSICKDDQHVIMCLRLGAFAFHQDCKKCGETVTRAHAMQCSGEEARLQCTFEELHARYVQSPEYKYTIFQDFLLNIMDMLYASRSTGDRERAMIIFSELSQSARCIRNTVSGYMQSVDGRAWYHPLKSTHKIRRYIHYRQKANVAVRSAAIRAAHPARRVGRPPRQVISQSNVTSFEPP